MEEKVKPTTGLYVQAFGKVSQSWELKNTKSRQKSERPPEYASSFAPSFTLACKRMGFGQTIK